MISTRRLSGAAGFLAGIGSVIWLMTGIGGGLDGTASAQEGPCSGLLVNFAGLQAGTVLGEQFAASGIHISVATPFPGSKDAVIIFDSDATGTPDHDLEVGLGNLAIIPRDLTDSNGDGLIDVPDDSAAGGVQIYTFDTARNIASFVFVDKDTNDPGTATAFDAPSGGNVIKQVSIPNGPNANVQTIALDASGVRRLEINYNDSGGVTDICLVQPTPTPTATPVSTPLAEATPTPISNPTSAVTAAVTVAAAALPPAAGTSVSAVPAAGGMPEGENPWIAVLLAMGVVLVLGSVTLAVAYSRRDLS